MSIVISRPVVVAPPASEPLTLTEAKMQVHLAESDGAFDSELVHAIQAAREQWEHDTDSATMACTLSVSADRFAPKIDLPKRPIVSIDSVTYHDADGVSQTLDPGVYILDLASGSLRLAHGRQWPDAPRRWDAVTMQYVAGYARRQDVPAVAKQAMRLLVGYYFDANRGDNDRPNDRRAYEALVMKFMRASYP